MWYSNALKFTLKVKKCTHLNIFLDLCTFNIVIHLHIDVYFHIVGLPGANYHEPWPSSQVQFCKLALKESLFIWICEVDSQLACIVPTASIQSYSWSKFHYLYRHPPNKISVSTPLYYGYSKKCLWWCSLWYKPVRRCLPLALSKYTRHLFNRYRMM